MGAFTIALLLLTVAGLCFSNDVIELQAEAEVAEAEVYEETERMLDLLSVPILPERYKSEDFKQQWGITEPLTDFKWKDCGGEGAQIKALTISPDPIKLPGKITVSLEIDVNTAIDAPLNGKLKLEKKILGVWIKMPCINNVGSCNYPDVCQNLKNGTCPPVLADHDIPCHCPFNTGKYKLPATEFDGPDLPSILVGGDYRVFGELFDINQKLLVCLELELSLS